MSAHIDVEALFAHADGVALGAGDAAHLETCAACREALARLTDGRALLDEAREAAPREPDWAAIDPAVLAAAESTARAIREGKLKAPSRWREATFFGVSLAVAAAGVVALGSRPVAAPVEAVAVAPGRAPQAVEGPRVTRYEAQVLLSAAGSAVGLAGAGRSPLASVARLAEGARIETARGGRAVLGLRDGWRVDLRGESRATLATLTTAASEVVLDAGEVALLRGEGATGPALRLRAHGWQVESEGATVGAWRADRLRVVVLAGRTAVSRDGAAGLTVTGPVVLELPLVGEAQRRDEAARDGDALDLAALDDAAPSLRVPQLEGVTGLSLGSGGPLPAGLESLCVRTPATLIARTARGRMTLELGAQSPAWQRSPMVASAAPATPHAAPQRVLPSPPAPAATPEAPSLTAGQRATMAAMARPRVVRCLATCVERNQCAESPSGVVEFTTSPEGQTRLSRLDPSMAGARRCLEHESQFLHFPGQAAPYAMQIPVGGREP